MISNYKFEDSFMLKHIIAELLRQTINKIIDTGLFNTNIIYIRYYHSKMIKSGNMKNIKLCQVCSCR